MLMQKEKKSHNDFKFGTFTGHFSSGRRDYHGSERDNGRKLYEFLSALCM